MYGKTTRSRIGSSGRTSGITGSPFRLAVIRRHAAIQYHGPRKRSNRRRPVHCSGHVRFFPRWSRLLRLDERDGSRRHRPDSAEAIDGDVAHVAGQDDRGDARDRRRWPRPRRPAARAAPCWSRPRPGPCRRVARPRVDELASFPSGRQFWPSKRASPSEVAAQIAPSLPRPIACTELAGEPFVLAPGPQLPLLPAADAGQRRVIGRAAVEQDAGQAGRRAAAPPAATFSSARCGRCCTA